MERAVAASTGVAGVEKNAQAEDHAAAAAARAAAGQEVEAAAPTAAQAVAQAVTQAGAVAAEAATQSVGHDRPRRTAGYPWEKRWPSAFVWTGPSRPS